MPVVEEIKLLKTAVSKLGDSGEKNRYFVADHYGKSGVGRGKKYSSSSASNDIPLADYVKYVVSAELEKMLREINEIFGNDEWQRRLSGQAKDYISGMAFCVDYERSKKEFEGQLSDIAFKDKGEESQKIKRELLKIQDGEFLNKSSDTFKLKIAQYHKVRSGAVRVINPLLINGIFPTFKNIIKEAKNGVAKWVQQNKLDTEKYKHFKNLFEMNPSDHEGLKAASQEHDITIQISSAPSTRPPSPIKAVRQSKKPASSPDLIASVGPKNQKWIASLTTMIGRDVCGDQARNAFYLASYLINYYIEAIKILKKDLENEKIPKAIIDAEANFNNLKEVINFGQFMEVERDVQKSFAVPQVDLREEVEERELQDDEGPYHEDLDKSLATHTLSEKVFLVLEDEEKPLVERVSESQVYVDEDFGYCKTRLNSVVIATDVSENLCGFLVSEFVASCGEIKGKIAEIKYSQSVRKKEEEQKSLSAFHKKVNEVEKEIINLQRVADEHNSVFIRQLKESIVELVAAAGLEIDDYGRDSFGLEFRQNEDSSDGRSSMSASPKRKFSDFYNDTFNILQNEEGITAEVVMGIAKKIDNEKLVQEKEKFREELLVIDSRVGELLESTSHVSEEGRAALRSFSENYINPLIHEFNGNGHGGFDPLYTSTPERAKSHRARSDSFVFDDRGEGGELDYSGMMSPFSQPSSPNRSVASVVGDGKNVHEEEGLQSESNNQAEPRNSSPSATPSTQSSRPATPLSQGGNGRKSPAVDL